MNVFRFLDYRDALRALVLERKQFERGFGFHALADAARIQRPYLSKVMKGTAQLSADQLFLIARLFKLGEEERDYLQLLLEHDRTSVAERKQELGDKIRAIADAHRDSSAHLRAKTLDSDAAASSELADYYLDPLVQIVHMAVSIDYFSKNPTAIANEFQIPGVQLHAILTKLDRLGLIQRDGKRIIQKQSSLHLPKASALYRAWRNQMKLLSAQRLNQLPEQESYSFSTVFSADPETRKHLHEKFLEFLKSCESSVEAAPARQVYQMSFDLFPWTTAR